MGHYLFFIHRSWILITGFGKWSFSLGLFLLISLSTMTSPVYSQDKLQSKEITEQFFADPDIAIPTPAFQKENGFTSYDEMMAFLQEFVNKNSDLVYMKSIGTSQEGRAITLLIFENKSSRKNKARVWFQGGLHGNEPASSEGLFYLMNQLVLNEAYQYLLDKVILAIVPMANTDGYEVQSRYAANGLDLNRDQTKLMIPETSVLKQAFYAFQPQVAVDFHEYRPFRKDYKQFGTKGITTIHDVMFLYSGNMNVAPKLRLFTKDLFIKNASHDLNQHQLRSRDYVSTRKVDGKVHFFQGALNARSSASSWALTNTVAALIEVRGVGLGRISFKRRVYSTFQVGLSFLQSTHDHVRSIKRIIRKSKRYKGPAVIESEAKISSQKLLAIDLASNSEAEFDVTIHDAWESTSIRSRNLPKAYLIEGGEKDIITKLKALGLKLEYLSKLDNIPVEKYRVTEYSVSPKKTEDIFRQQVKTKLEKEIISISAPCYYLSMKQKNARLAIELLEPEAPNSFVSWGIIQASKGGILPVYRVLKNLK